MSWFLTNLIGALLLPPFNLLLAALAGLLLLRRHPRLGRALLAGSILLLWLCSTSFVAHGALRLLEEQTQAVNPQTQPADAIVVLGGGSYPSAPEYGGNDTVGSSSLERLRYAAKLQHDTGKPILVTGGDPEGIGSPEARQMKDALENSFHVPVQWTEEASNNTLENARFSYPILQKAGIKRIYLVTHSWHMPRAAMAFRSAGFEVVPAPLAFNTGAGYSLLSFVPDARSLYGCRTALHELIGLLWYRLKS